MLQFSTLTAPFLFSSNRRLERPPRRNQDTSQIKPPGVLNNTLSGDRDLNTNRFNSSLKSPPCSPLSSISSKSSRTAVSITSMSPHSSHQSSRSKLSPRHQTSYDTATTPKASSFTDAKPKYASRATSSSGTSSQGSLPALPDIHVRDARSHTSRPSSSSSRLDAKERKVPPPLHLDDSNLHPKNSQAPPAIEIIAPGPPRVESRLSSHTVDPESPDSYSPDFEMPTEEEVRRKRHEKVMRTLGERVPAELVHRGARIPNVTMFPEPPSRHAIDNDTPRGGNTGAKLARQGSFTLSSFPNLSSVTATFLPASHGRSKSRGALDFSDSFPTAKPLARKLSRSHHTPRPETSYSPITFATALERTPAPTSVEGGGYDSSPLTPQQKEAKRATKLARRASLSTTTFLPSSPLRDGFRDLDPLSSQASRHHHPALLESTGVELEISAHPRPESTLMSPLVFANHLSLVLAPPDLMREQDVDDDVEDESNTAGSRTPPQRQLHSQSETGHDSGSESHAHSKTHLPLLPRPGTPFQDVVPMSGYLAPPGTGKDMLQRRERRQGWSGEWNQDDMQDVIRKLRNLK